MATYRSLFNHKRGDTFQYVGTVQLPDGNWLVAAQVRVPAKIDTPPPLADLEVSLTPGSPLTGILLFAPPEATALWPIGLLICDIQFTEVEDPENVLSTDTFGFTLIKDVTHVDPA